MMTTLSEFCNTSYTNIILLLIVGVIFRFLSSIYDSSESNGIELSIAFISRAGCFICMIFSCVALVFNGRNLLLNNYNDYKVACQENAYDMLGGEEGLFGIDGLQEEFASLDIGVNTSEIDSFQGAADTAKQTIVALSAKEMSMLQGVE